MTASKHFHGHFRSKRNYFSCQHSSETIKQLHVEEKQDVTQTADRKFVIFPSIRNRLRKKRIYDIIINSNIQSTRHRYKSLQIVWRVWHTFLPETQCTYMLRLNSSLYKWSVKLIHVKRFSSSFIFRVSDWLRWRLRAYKVTICLKIIVLYFIHFTYWFHMKIFNFVYNKKLNKCKITLFCNFNFNFEKQFKFILINTNTTCSPLFLLYFLMQTLYRQIVGIPMGAPLVADLFLFCYERDFTASLSDLFHLKFMISGMTLFLM